VLQGVGETGRRIGPALALAAMLALPATAKVPVQPATYDSPAQILKAFPGEVGPFANGVRLRLTSGDWTEVVGNSFGEAPPVICWYAPALHVAGVCQNAPGVTLTILIDLRSGRRVSAPGRASLTAERALIAIGPGGPHHAPSDSVTLVRVTSTGLIEEGGAEFGDDYQPGGWIDARCYRLKAKGPGPGGWLEKTAQGWRQVAAAQSEVCQRRHGG
jgi:hypothetical protein